MFETDIDRLQIESVDLEAIKQYPPFDPASRDESN